ncbi:MAG TPA: CoA ester lyase [Burkholderiaceae bacterium]|nr:CoA ester lyase [Burkholderiaceae bacterium]
MSRTPGRLRRSVLYVPASNPRALGKARNLGADAIVVDLEDAVAPAAKPAPRAALLEQFASGGFAPAEAVIRVNAVGTPELAADLEAVAQARPDAVLLPKVDGPEDLQAFAQAAARAGVDPGIGLWAMVETAAGLCALEAIVAAGSSSRPVLDCLVIGTNDIAKETGVFPGEQRMYLMPWLMNVVLIAKRHRICVLDGVWNEFRDQAGFEAEARQSARMAFDGKTLIHPTQVEPANRLFSPSAEAIADARRIVAAFALPEHANSNVINLGGRMVERLHLEQAQRLLAVPAAGATNGG